MKYTGLKRISNNKYIRFFYNEEGLQSDVFTINNMEELYFNEDYPVWLLRHSLGEEHLSEEDYSEQDNYMTPKESHNERISRCIQKDGSLKNLFYSSLKIPVSDFGYSHSVGPIHAGIIEPGHFRFSLLGKEISHLTIRLGFQRRNIIKLLHNKPAYQALPILESVSGDSTVSYSLAGVEIFEKAHGIEIEKFHILYRLVLLELERIAIHIGDLGALAEDIGYYPLQGICARDRGVPLGILESLTGSRFARGAILPGYTELRHSVDSIQIETMIQSLTDLMNLIDDAVSRTLSNSTIRERFQGCGSISKEACEREGFLGMVKRQTGMIEDLRSFNKIYTQYGRSPVVENDPYYLTGDMWGRFGIRYLEVVKSIKWLIPAMRSLELSELKKLKLITSMPKCKEGFYSSSIEGWRGPNLVFLSLDGNGKIQDSYIRDPSVLNWHALELAVRGELIGDFPMNNKSFNLSYVGFDL